jgi:hypothetical protein
MPYVNLDCQQLSHLIYCKLWDCYFAVKDDFYLIVSEFSKNHNSSDHVKVLRFKILNSYFEDVFSVIHGENKVVSLQYNTINEELITTTVNTVKIWYLQTKPFNSPSTEQGDLEFKLVFKYFQRFLTLSMICEKTLRLNLK